MPINNKLTITNHRKKSKEEILTVAEVIQASLSVKVRAKMVCGGVLVECVGGGFAVGPEPRRAIGALAGAETKMMGADVTIVSVFMLLLQEAEGLIGFFPTIPSLFSLQTKRR